MRISDWSSDVCSSDLLSASRPRSCCPAACDSRWCAPRLRPQVRPCVRRRRALQGEIGRASCRERVCQYVSISVVAVSLTKTKKKYMTHETTRLIELQKRIKGISK